MKGKIITLCVLALVTIPVLTATANELGVPNEITRTTVPFITGPTEGIIGKTYEYTVTYMDPQGDDVYYKIVWGDCMVIFHDGPINQEKK